MYPPQAMRAFSVSPYIPPLTETERMALRWRARRVARAITQARWAAEIERDGDAIGWAIVFGASLMLAGDTGTGAL